MRGVFIDANGSLATIFERQNKAGDPTVKVNRNADITADEIPAAMVFVPCKDGVSHNELEDATQLDCAAGGNVLLHTVLALAGVAS